MRLANFAPVPAFASDVLEALIQPHRRREKIVTRLFDGDGALRRRADKPRRVFLGKAEIDEEFRIVDFHVERRGLHRRLERKRKMQRQHGLFRIVVEIVVDRIEKCVALAFAVHLGVGEIGVLLERLDIDLGERVQLLAGELPLGLLVQALGGVGREHVVEGPGMTHAGDRAVRRVDKLLGHRHPDMRVRLGGQCRRQ